MQVEEHARHSFVEERYLPSAHVEQFVLAVPEHVAQEVSQQVEFTSYNVLEQDVHVDSVPEHVSQELEQAKQEPSEGYLPSPQFAVQVPLEKSNPVLQVEQSVLVVPEHVAQEGSQQVLPRRERPVAQERQFVAVSLHVLHEVEQARHSPLER